MKNTIGRKIIIILLAPSLLIFGLLSALIVYVASHLQTAAPDSFLPVLIPIAGITAASLILILLAVVYVKKKISDPLKALMLAANAVSYGNLETEIPSFSSSKDEIGILSCSLQRMLEQLRVCNLRLEQLQDEKTIYSMLDNLMMTGGVSKVMKGLSVLLCERLGVDRATAVCLSEGSARIFSRRENGAELIGTDAPPDFLYHTQVMPMLQGKKLLFMNAYIISGQSMDFLDKDTCFACILPLREEHSTIGYIILERRNGKTPFGAKVESSLRGIAAPLAAFIRNDPAPAEPVRETDAPESPCTFREMDGLDSDKAIETMGGMADLYEQVLNLLAKTLPETIEKLDANLAADIAAFAIEIHGLKGSLNNVGAYSLGAEAARIEQAAKSGDAPLCAESYASFKVTLTDFYQRLVSSIKSGHGKSPGDIRELVKILPQAEEAAESRDCDAVLESLRPVNEFSFDSETDALLLDIITSLESGEDEKSLEDIRNLRERLAHWEEA